MGGFSVHDMLKLVRSIASVLVRRIRSRAVLELVACNSEIGIDPNISEALKTL
jgi:hypothetical protein